MSLDRRTTTSPLQTPSLRLDDRVAVITGAGRGIGMGCAIAVAEAGADVVLVSRTRRDLDRVADKIRANGRKAKPVVCDVTQPQQVAEVIGGLERVDILVNGAGTNIPQPFLEVTGEPFERMFDVNVKGTFFVSQAAARRMVEQTSGGVILNISSDFGHVGSPLNRSVYCATKHAIEGLTRATALELGTYGIRVNSIAPTFVETSMTRPHLADEAFREAVERSIPLGRIGQIEDIMGAVVFLASPAAALITGASLLVDGGWTAQ